MFFDLVLVFTTFRKCGHYLPLVRELSPNYRIGLYICPLDRNNLEKTDTQNKLFVDLIYSFGVINITHETSHCKIMLVPQWHYYSEDIDRIYKNIQSTYHYWVVGLANGNSSYENLNNNKIDKVLVVDENFYNYRLSKRPQEQAIKFPEGAIVEVGTPYLKYPVFDSIEIDYIIANPTPFSFPMLEDKIEYLNNVLGLLRQIPIDKTIAYKPHNAYGSDSLVHPKIYRFMNSFSIDSSKKLIYGFFRILHSLSNIKLINKICIQFEIINKQSKIMHRVQPLKEITKYHDFNLEMFLPHVKEGVITGRSNSIWHALHAKLTVYNCIPNSTKEVTQTLKRLAPNQLFGEKMHHHNMVYFNIACCESKMDFDMKKTNIVEDRTRKSNLVDFIQKDLGKK